MLSSFAALIGRLFIALFFIVDGAGKLIDAGAGEPSGAQSLLTVQGTQIFGGIELLLGLALAIGAALRTVTLLLVILTIVQLLFVYRPYTDPLIADIALLHVAVLGGLLGLFAYGHMHWSYDALRDRRRREKEHHAADLAERDRALRDREAQLQAQRNAGIAPHVTPGPDAPVVPSRPIERR